MSKKKLHYYVVWKGRQAGIFDSWATCEEQIKGFAGAEYKGFKTRAEADEAFRARYADYRGKKVVGVDPRRLEEVGQPILDSWSVDAACSPAPGTLEYRCVNTRTVEIIFQQGPFEDGTNNIGEFLAIVHALAECHRLGLEHPIYSDSYNAIRWVEREHCNTNLKRTPNNAPLFTLIKRAEEWLSRHSYPNQVLKWETDVWGEIPADYGRK